MVWAFDENAPRELPAKIHAWIPPGRRKRGWPWWNGITEAVARKGDGFRRRIGLSTLEKRIGKVTDHCMNRI
jgi:hypothetical protein